jgi:hypothetical protein
VLPGRWGRILDLAYLGMLANYFAKALAAGLDGEYRGPDAPRINHFKDEFVMPGLAFLVLLTGLFALPGYQAYRMVRDAAKTAEGKLEELAQRGYDRPDLKVAGLDPNEVFLDESGKIVHPKATDPPMVLKRSDGSWVRTEPAWGAIVYIPGNDPKNAAQIDSPPQPDGASSSAGASGDDDEKLNVQLIPKGQAFMLLVLFLVPFLYIPMGLAVASEGETMYQMYNPAYVVGAAVRAGVPYVIIVLVGFGAMFVPAAAAVKFAVAGGTITARAIFLVGYAYTIAVQGYAMGCLARQRPDVLPALLNR